MATFARPSFGFANYAAFRPTYPEKLYRTVLAYHNERSSGARAGSDGGSSKMGTLLDIGTGHGTVARTLAPHFAAVHAVDPSAGMVEQARKLQAEESHVPTKVDFRQGSAEDLSFLSGGSLDMVVSAQAAHWFDFTRAWPALAGAVRKGGTLAFWGYKDHIIVGHPGSSDAFDRFTYGTDTAMRAQTGPGPAVEGMGRFWENPGRRILREGYSSVDPPATDWEDVRRLVFDPDRKLAAIPADTPDELLWLRKRLTLGQLESYTRTYSAYSNWRQAHPDMRPRGEGGEGDVVDVMFDEVVAATPEWAAAAGGGWRDIEVDAVWGTAILLARRR